MQIRVRRGRMAPGGLWEDITGKVQAAVSGGQRLVAAANDVLQDPALPEVVNLVLRLKQIQKAQGGLGYAYPPLGDTPGIGLSKIVKPLRFYVQTREKPWLLPVLVAAAIGVPFYLGYLTGKKR